QAFRRELEEIALKHLGKVSENTTTSTTSVNTGSELVNTVFLQKLKSVLRIHSIHPKSQILGDPKSAVQTRSKEEPRKIDEALQDDSWVESMQEELLQFKLQQVWVLVDLPHGMKVIGIAWICSCKAVKSGSVNFNTGRLLLVAGKLTFFCFNTVQMLPLQIFTVLLSYKGYIDPRPRTYKWNLPFLGTKGLTSPEQTATVNVADMKGCWKDLKNSCCRDQKEMI
ncbi:hypothetical protein Tco_1161691, partial [Tanacetum coccineum]